MARQEAKTIGARLLWADAIWVDELWEIWRVLKPEDNESDLYRAALKRGMDEMLRLAARSTAEPVKVTRFVEAMASRVHLALLGGWSGAAAPYVEPFREGYELPKNKDPGKVEADPRTAQIKGELLQDYNAFRTWGSDQTIKAPTKLALAIGLSITARETFSVMNGADLREVREAAKQSSIRGWDTVNMLREKNASEKVQVAIERHRERALRAMALLTERGQ